MIKLLYISEFSGTYPHAIFSGMVRRSREINGELSVFGVPPSYVWQNGREGLVRYARTLGVNVVIGQFSDDDDLSIFERNGIVAFEQDSRITRDTLPRLTEDYEGTGRIAADFLVQCGFRNFGYFGVSNTRWSKFRCQGFLKSLEELGAADNFYTNTKASWDTVWNYDFEELEEWLRSLPKPIALLACNDSQGLKLMQACTSAGIEVPSEVSILTIDNNEIMCNLSPLPLSSILIDVASAGYDLAVLAEEMLKNGDFKGHDIYAKPRRIVQRLSVANIYSSDNHVHRALSYIHSNLDRKINVNDVLSQVPLSRRLLEERFKKATGESIYAYILRNRIERFANLLIENNLPISAIASMLGEEDPRSISRRFKAIKGCTPEEWRDKYCVI